jgi:hypothetical protein
MDLEAIEAAGVPKLPGALVRGQVVIVNAASAPRTAKREST